LCYRNDTRTYEVDAIRILVLLNECVDRPVFHPVRNHQAPFLAKRNANQRKDIGVSEVSPDHRLFAEPLNRTSGTSPVGIGSEDTYPDDYFAIDGTELYDLDSHWAPLVIPLEHACELSAVHRVFQ